VSDKPKSDKLNIANEMRQLDRKNRKFYDELTDEERKQFSLYLMIRWSSSIENGNTDKEKLIQQYYLQSCNENLNKHFFAINKHPKLQWLCATTISPNQGTQQHKWITLKKKETSAGASSIKKQLAELFPTYKEDEIAMLASMTTKKELDQYIRDHGRDTK
jgi:hypothetical protein